MQQHKNEEANMNSIVVAMFIIAVAVIAVITLIQKKEGSRVDYPYRKIDVLFTPAERSFLGVLNQAVGENVQIFGKVRVADVISPKKDISRSDRQKAFNKISGKHFDFLLCNKNNLSIICAIELNDSSHSSKNRQQRDIFLDGVCKTAGVPLITITNKASYTMGEITELLAPYLGSSISSVLEFNKPTNVEITTQKLCPKCSSPMVKKIAKKGNNAGNEFWACSAFPNCRHVEAINI
jgi:hypothetical protein